MRSEWQGLFSAVLRRQKNVINISFILIDVIHETYRLLLWDANPLLWRGYLCAR